MSLDDVPASHRYDKDYAPTVRYNRHTGEVLPWWSTVAPDRTQRAPWWRRFARAVAYWMSRVGWGEHRGARA